VSSSGISWAICKSALCSRQITTPTPYHSVFYRPDARRPTNSVKALKALQLGKMNANSSPVPAGRRGGADLRFCSHQPDTTLHCLRDHGYGAIAHRVACLQCLLPSFRRYKQLPYLQTLWKSGEICRQTTEMQGAILNVFFFSMFAVHV